MLQNFTIRVGFPSSRTSRSSSPFAARKIGPPALFCCPSSLLSAPLPRGCLHWQSMCAICATGIQPPVFRFRSTYAETTNSAMLATPTNAGLLALSCPPAQLAAVFTLHTRLRRRKSPTADQTSGTVEHSAFLILKPTKTSGLPSFYPVFTPLST